VRHASILLLIAVGAAAGVGYVAVRYHARLTSPQAAQPVKPTAVPATVAHVERRDVPIWLSGIGTVQPINAVTVKPRVDGQLISTLFSEGQDVHAGDVLARIDPRPFQAALDQTVAKREQDEAQLANAKVDLARYNKLMATQSTSEQQAATQRALVAQLAAQVEQDQAAIAMAQLQFDFTTIKAPLDGRVGLRLVDPGSVVHASDPNGIVTITQMQPIDVLFALPEDDLPRIREAMARGDVKVAAYDRDSDRILLEGKLVFIDSQIDPTTGQIKLKALFGNEGRVLWPGQFVTVRVLVETIKQATVVHTSAIERGENGTYVFRLRPDDTVEVQPVKLGPAAEQSTVVFDGLSVGDRIVIDGQYRLKPGVRVDPHAPTPAGQS
jgi:multidrug efflux system membrane fusion protein